MRDVDVIYCCMFGVEVEDGDGGFFDVSILMSYEGRKKGRLICVVGGIEGERRELLDELVKLVMRQYVGYYWYFYKYVDEGGVVVVDIFEGVMKYVMEFVVVKVEFMQMVEYVYK